MHWLGSRQAMFQQGYVCTCERQAWYLLYQRYTNQLLHLLHMCCLHGWCMYVLANAYYCPTIASLPGLAWSRD